MDQFISAYYWYRFSILGVLLVFQIACSSQPKSSLSSEKDQLIFGRGGGMSGEIKSHILMNNGQLYATSSLYTDTVHIADIELKVIRRIFDQVDSLQFAALDFQHPGNRYYFVRHQQQEIVWGSDDNPPPAAVKQLYDSLQNIVPEQK